MPGAPLSRYLAAGVRADELDAAVVAGVWRPTLNACSSPPLLASAVLSRIPPARRRELHALAASSAEDAEEKVRHHALAASGPSAAIADRLEEAAGLAELRGAPATAAELLELAASITPRDHAEDAHRRLLSAGRQLAIAGETRAAAAVLNDLAAIVPPGPRHAEVLAHLGMNSEDDFEASTGLLDQAALAEADAAPVLSASIHVFLSDRWAALGRYRPGANGDAWCGRVRGARAGAPTLLAPALAQAVIFDWMCGRSAPADGAAPPNWTPSAWSWSPANACSA